MRLKILIYAYTATIFLHFSEHPACLWVQFG